MNLATPFARALAAGGFLAACCSLPAAEFHPIAELGTNMTDGNPGGNPLSNIIEGPGIGFAAAEPHDGPSATWYTDDPGGFPSDYIAVHPGPEYLWFDLGMDVLLSEISYWGYTPTNANGVREFNLNFATDAEGGAAGLGDEDYGVSITANPAFEAAIDNVARQSFAFETVLARYVRVEVTSNYFSNGGNGPPPGGDRIGVGEIAFENIAFDPNPQISVPSEVALELTTSVVEIDISVSNVGGAELSISGANLIGPNASAFSVFSLPTSVASLSSEVIELRFDPAGLVGPVSATLQVMSNDPDDPTAEILLTGTVPPTERDIVVPGPVDRGAITLPEVFDLPVMNGGGSALTITGTAFVGPSASAFSVVSAPASIAALSTGTFQIQIDPAGLLGPISATLQIMSDDPDTPTAEVTISGIVSPFYPIAGVQSSTAANDLWPVSNLIQGPGVGFEATPPYTKTLDGAAGNWVTAACGFPCDYIATTGMPVLTFDLGANVHLCEISVWGYSNTNSNGASEFSLRFATEADGPSGFGTSIDFNPTFAGIDSGELPNADHLSRFSFLFGQEITARYVEFTCVDNHFIAPGDGSGGEIPGGDRVGLGEVAFEIRDCEPPTFFFDLEAQGDDLVLTWESNDRQLYNVRSETDPASGEPITWPIFDAHAAIPATPPLNMLTIARPADPFRLFVVEGFPTPPVTVFSDDFESGQGEWTTGNDGDPGTDWELGTPAAAIGPQAAHSPDNCFGTNLGGDYEINAVAWLRSPAIDLTAAAEATLTYWRFTDIEQMFDFGLVRVLDATDDSLLEVIEMGIDGLSTDWEQVRLGLPASALGKTIRIEFLLDTDDFVDDLEFAGFYVDDVEVTAR